MDTNPTESFSEEEAEAALLSFAPRLTWRRVTSYVCGSDTAFGQYTVVTEPGGDGTFISRFARGEYTDWNPTFFPNLAQAQAACERHFVTGEWGRKPLNLDRFVLESWANDQPGVPQLTVNLWIRRRGSAGQTLFLCAEVQDADDARAALTELLLERGWSQRSIDDFFASPKREQDTHFGPWRRLCLLCGLPIHRQAWANGTLCDVQVQREGIDTGYVSVHQVCLGERRDILDLTGHPDYSGYEEDGAKPAFPEGYDAVARGWEADAACARARNVAEPADHETAS